jgi:hypothetical protein
LARIVKYERGSNQRCPADDFLDDIERPMRNRFLGQFDALGKDGGGSAYCNQQRFRPLTGAGKPLWEFKEHDHRLYCSRKEGLRDSRTVTVVLFNGWVKDKDGRTQKEDREIDKALTLHREFLMEYPEGTI